MISPRTTEPFFAVANERLLPGLCAPQPYSAVAFANCRGE
jgi:hypothetical protein